MKTFIMQRKKQRGFTLVEVIIILTIIGVLASIAIPAYQEYTVRGKWMKARASIGALKLAIGECLHDAKGEIAACNDLSAEKLGKYQATLPSPTKDILSISIVKKNAAIRIRGADNLGGCVVDLEPKFQKESVDMPIYWLDPVAQSVDTEGDTLEQCQKYVAACGG